MSEADVPIYRLHGHALGEILNWVPFSSIKRLLSTGDGTIYHRIMSAPSLSHLVIDDGSDIFMDAGRIWSHFRNLRAIYGSCPMEACLDVSFANARCKPSVLHFPQLSIQFPETCLPNLSNLTHLSLHTLYGAVEVRRALASQLQSLSVDYFCWVSQCANLKDDKQETVIWPNLTTLELRQCEDAGLPSEMSRTHPKLTALSLHLQRGGFGTLDASALSNVTHFELFFDAHFKSAMREYFATGVTNGISSKVTFPPALLSVAVGLSPSCAVRGCWHSATCQINLMRLLPPTVTTLTLCRYAQLGTPDYDEFKLEYAPRDLRRIVATTRELVRSTDTNRWVTLHDVLSKPRGDGASEAVNVDGICLRDFRVATKLEPCIRSQHHVAMIQQILDSDRELGAKLVRFVMAHDYRTVLRFGNERLLAVALPEQYDLEGLRRWIMFARDVFCTSMRPLDLELLTELAGACDPRMFRHMMHLLTLVLSATPNSAESFIVAGMRHRHVGHYNMSLIHQNAAHRLLYWKMADALVNIHLFSRCISRDQLAQFLALMDSVIIRDMMVE